MSERSLKIAKLEQSEMKAVTTKIPEKKVAQNHPLKFDQLTLFGDHIDAATRSILMLLDELSLPYQFVEVDTQAEVHLTTAFKTVCTWLNTTFHFDAPEY